VRYIPHWERLGDALKRVMATGAYSSEEEAKTDLCRAMADREINVRVKIAASSYSMRGRLFSEGNVGVPSHLKSGDLDWEQSRSLQPWSIGPMPGQHYFGWDWKNLPLDLIELWTADVIDVLCRGGEEEAAIKTLALHLKSNRQLTRAEAAELCRKSGYNLGKRAFERVWPEARERAGLERIASPGRKRKSPR
jgi:hypothetical protein